MSKHTQIPDPAQPTGQIDPTLDHAPPLFSLDSTGPGPSLTAPPVTPPPYNPGLPRTFGRYQLLEVLGQGGMGVVYKAKQTGLERMVALKMILAGPGASEQAVARFHREAQSASSLDHPNIVPIYDFGDDQGQHYFTMAFVEGETLHRLVERAGALPASEAIRIMLALTAAMGYAHRKGLIHRDLKPDNVLIDREGQPRILDFGLARLVEGDRLTASGQILGTPSYMSPEQARGESNIGPASDIYSLGAVLYFLLTRQRPFEGESALKTLIRVAHEIPVPPRQVNIKISTALDAICMRCLEKDPDQRYASAEALAEALRNAESSPAVQAQPTRPNHTRATVATGPEKLAVSPSRRWIGVLAGLLAVVAIAVVGGYFALHKKEQPTTAEVAEPEDPLLPKNLTQEFGLKVEVIGEKEEKNGRYILKPGVPFKLQITVERDAYVGVWNYGESGNVIQLFPTDDEKANNLLKAGKVYTIPGDDLEFTPNAAKRPEHMRIIASTTKWDAIKGTSDGGWLVFKTAEERQRLADGIRDVTVKRKKKPEDPQAPKVSEAVVPYWVK